MQLKSNVIAPERQNETDLEAENTVVQSKRSMFFYPRRAWSQQWRCRPHCRQWVRSCGSRAVVLRW